MKCTIEEIWRSVENNSKYEVSNEGRVRRASNKRLLKLTTSNGYKRVMLGQKGPIVLVHRLVLSAFLRSPIEKEECNHKNGIRSDNRLVNLEWCTRSENVLHKINILKNGIGMKHGLSRFTDKEVMDMRARRLSGESLVSIGKLYKTSHQTVLRIANGKAWKHLPILGVKKCRRTTTDEMIRSIRKIRLEENATQANIADRFGIDQSTVSQILNSKYKRYRIEG